MILLYTPTMSGYFGSLMFGYLSNRRVYLKVLAMCCGGSFGGIEIL